MGADVRPLKDRETHSNRDTNREKETHTHAETYRETPGGGGAGERKGAPKG